MRQLLPVFLFPLFFCIARAEESPFPDNDDIFSDEDIVAIEPDANGIMDLGVERGILANAKLRHYHSSIYSTYQWSRNSFASWKVKVPEKKAYAVEICWANKSAPYNLDVNLNGIKAFDWRIESTNSWASSNGDAPLWHFYYKKIGSIELPAGESSISVTTPEPEEEGKPIIDLSSLRLVPLDGLEDKLHELKLRPRLGMSLEEIQLLWGKGMYRGATESFERKGSPGDKDFGLYEGMSVKCTARRWAMPGMQISAFFFSGQCVDIDVNIWGDKSREAAWAIASSILPEVTFDKSKIPANGLFTSYSPDMKYKLQYWGDYFEIKASALLKTLKLKEINELQPLLSRPILGMTYEEVAKIWGPGKPRLLAVFPYEQGDKNDVDWEMFSLIKPCCKSFLWSIPAKKQERTAIFWQGQCIALDINRLNMPFLPSECMPLVKEFLPNVQFGKLPPDDRMAEFTLYSTKPSKAYKFQKWSREHKFFELKAPALVRKIQEQCVIKQRAQSPYVVKRLQENPALQQYSLFGKTNREIHSILGEPHQDGPLEDKYTALWLFPDCEIGLAVSFTGSGAEDICTEISVVARQQPLNLDAGLPIARQLASPAALPAETPKSWFEIRSLDAQKRFTAKYYKSPSLGSILTITDNMAKKPVIVPEVSKEKQSQLKAVLDNL